jgi:hypothetical protein
VIRNASRMILLQLGLLAALLTVFTATAVAQPTRDHPYPLRSHPYAVTTVAQPAQPRVITVTNDGFSWSAFALGATLPAGVVLLGCAALMTRTGRLPRPRTSR